MKREKKKKTKRTTMYVNMSNRYDLKCSVDDSVVSMIFHVLVVNEH
jgi:hypothetical protein